MTHCNTCSKPSTKCNCPTEKASTCTPVDKCQPKQQIDTKEVFYKRLGECYSNLDQLGIGKGASLEEVLETFGRFITSFNYFDVSDNIYDAVGFNAFIKALQDDLSMLNLTLNNLSEKIEINNLELIEIKNRLDKLEKPQIIDSRGLGFTRTDSIFKVLQTLSNNG